MSLVLASWLRQFIFWISLMVLAIGLIGVVATAAEPPPGQANPTNAPTRNLPQSSQNANAGAMTSTKTTGRWVYAARFGAERLYFDAGSLAYDAASRQALYLLAVIAPNGQSVTLNQEDCGFNLNRWNLGASMPLNPRAFMTEAMAKNPASKPARDSVGEQVNHKVCYCARYPDSITCQPEGERILRIDNWANPSPTPRVK